MFTAINPCKIHVISPPPGQPPLTLLWLPLIFWGAFEAQLVLFGVIFGMLDVATVPPVIVLFNRVFGCNGVVVFGWINAFHQLGAVSMASGAG